MDWTELTGPKSTAGSIANWFNNSTITSGTLGVADLLLKEGQDWIYRRLRHWRMLTPPVTGTMTIGQDFITPPGDMLEPDMLLITGVNYCQLKQRPMQEIVLSWSYDGSGNRVPQQPSRYYFDQSGIRFDSPADQAYPYALIYYQQPPMLGATNTTNFLTDYCQRLVRCACMTTASEWTKDSGVGNFDRTYWEQAAQAELDAVQMESDRARRATQAGAVFIGGGGGGEPLYSW